MVIIIIVIMIILIIIKVPTTNMISEEESWSIRVMIREIERSIASIFDCVMKNSHIYLIHYFTKKMFY